MPESRISAVPVDEVVRRYRDEGEGVEQITRDLRERGITISTASVRKVLKGAKVQFTGRRRKVKPGNSGGPAKQEQPSVREMGIEACRLRVGDRGREIAQRFFDGEMIKDLAKEVDVPPYSLTKILKAAGHLPNVPLTRLRTTVQTPEVRAWMEAHGFRPRSVH